MAKSFHTNLTYPNSSLTGTLHAEVFLSNDDNDTNGNEVQQQQDASQAMQPLLEIENDQANLAGLENNGKHRQSWMDLHIQDDSSTEDEWFLNSNPHDEDMHNAPDILFDFESLPDDLNLEDPVPPHNDDDDSFRSILEQGILEEPHAENEAPPQPPTQARD
jgi:hypothetical protein